MSPTSPNRTSFLPAEVSWDNWGSLFLEANLWRPVVWQICKETAVSPAKHIEAGFPGSCAVFVVDEQVVVKLYPPMMVQDFHREREVYGLLDGRLPHLARLLGDGIYHDRIDWPYLLLEFCEGVAIREVLAEIVPSNRLLIAQELAEMLKVVHGTAVTNVTTFDPSPAAWSEFVADRRAKCIDELRQKDVLPESVLAELADFIERVALGDERPILINADLTEDHLLLGQRERQWQISALLDWADAEVGALEYEWVMVWLSLCQRDSAMFRELLHVYDPELSVDDDFLDRMMAYTLLHRFGAGTVEHELRRDGRPPIQSLTELQTQLWGKLRAE